MSRAHQTGLDHPVTQVEKMEFVLVLGNYLHKVCWFSLQFFLQENTLRLRLYMQFMALLVTSCG